MARKTITHKFFAVINNICMEFTTVVEKNQQIIKDRLPAKDVVFSPFKIGNKSALVVYIDSLCEKEIVGELVLAPLLKLTGRITLQSLLTAFAARRLQSFPPRKKQFQTS